MNPQGQLTKYNNAKSTVYRSSPIQTVLSAPESHRICSEELAGFTAGREFHPSLKILLCYSFVLTVIIAVKLLQFNYSANFFQLSLECFCFCLLAAFLYV